ncbi:hypothetical protein USDA257_p01230 (plasmid) [Sinorhizobium fredii USDA 257]|uniref:Uncharacterized protein n=1 Tax=Sinorhizobium fredii (strain USDA 257) TaxID=1185652 RepID=I3XG34_SINF2|nr:hypothetical protein USDA257_p01230 [Sinorhizobium fredii USDA 257]
MKRPPHTLLSSARCYDLLQYSTKLHMRVVVRLRPGVQLFHHE